MCNWGTHRDAVQKAEIQRDFSPLLKETPVPEEPKFFKISSYITLTWGFSGGWKAVCLCVCKIYYPNSTSLSCSIYFNPELLYSTD